MTTTETTQAPVREPGHAPEIPSKNLPPVGYRDLPDAPPLRKILGPSVILVGVGIATGEYILWPHISSQVGLVFLWAAPLGVLMQYFINMAGDPLQGGRRSARLPDRPLAAGAARGSAGRTAGTGPGDRGGRSPRA